MGWITMSKPGDKYGPCKRKCKHKDCEATRKEAGTPCLHCGEPIGYETKYYCDNSDGTRRLEHFVCAWEAEEKRRKAM
jgi:hypothetical protein